MRQARSRTAFRTWAELGVLLAGWMLIQVVIGEHWTVVADYGNDLIRMALGMPVKNAAEPDAAGTGADGLLEGLPDGETAETESRAAAPGETMRRWDTADAAEVRAAQPDGEPYGAAPGETMRRWDTADAAEVRAAQPDGEPYGAAPGEAMRHAPEPDAAEPSVPPSPETGVRTDSAAGTAPAAPAGKAALTFDDGPDGKYTPMVLDILAQYGVTATFFVVGTQAELYPDVLARIRDEGHEIGSHGYAHADMGKMKAAAAAEDLRRADEAIQEAAGIVPTLFRPPYGSVSKELKAVLEEAGKTLVRWNIDPRDWDGAPAEEIVSHVLEHAKDGAVILLHSFGGKNSDLSGTIEALPAIIEGLLAQGYELVTVSGLEREDG